MDCRLEVRFEMLACRLQGPALAIEPSPPFGRGLAQGEMGQDVQSCIAVARRLIQLSPETPEQGRAPQNP